MQNLTARAMRGETDRSLKFGKSSGMWLLNDRGWDHADTLGELISGTVRRKCCQLRLQPASNTLLVFI